MYIEKIWTDYSSKLKAYILKRIPDKYEAEDILQEVGIRLQRNAGNINDITDVEASLHRIAHNLIVDYFRRRNKYSYLEDVNNDISVPAATEQENFNNETANCLLKLIDCLPAAYKEAIIESDYKGTKQNTLGQKWGLSISGSKTRIQRARKKLKAELLSCCEVKSDGAGNIIDFHHKKNVETKFTCIKC